MERIDILIYAHDGRGLGHVSRSVAIGMALRRLFPELRVLFVSGCAAAQELIGGSQLDWIKLPSYKTRVVNGKSQGADGNTNFNDSQLGQLRNRGLAQVIELYRPKLVLVDHAPQGKHKELLSALEEGRRHGTLWVLGVRGVVGSVKQLSSELARDVFTRYYDSLLWYGDSSVLSSAHLELLHGNYGVKPVECGYVLRMAELEYVEGAQLGGCREYAGTVAIPWLGELTFVFLQQLTAALKEIPNHYGSWQIFVDMKSDSEKGERVRAVFKGLDNCRLHAPGSRYAEVLPCSKTALIYGGYNSLMDIVYTQTPAVVVLREMQDGEQQIHLQALGQALPGLFSVVSEQTVTAVDLERMLLENLNEPQLAPRSVDIQGATTTAAFLHSRLSG